MQRSVPAGEAGLLDGRKCTTHWKHVDEFSARFPTAFARRMLVPPQRDGGQRQFVQAPMPASADSLAPVLDWMVDNLEREHPVAELARRAAMSERTFARRFVAETGTPALLRHHFHRTVGLTPTQYRRTFAC